MTAQTGIENQCRFVSWAEFFEQLAADRRLAGTDLARELDEAFSFTNTEQQMVERLLMLAAEEKKTRVRRDIERRFPKIIVLQIHRIRPPFCDTCASDIEHSLCRHHPPNALRPRIFCVATTKPLP